MNKSRHMQPVSAGPKGVHKTLSVGIVGAGLIVNNAHLPALVNTPATKLAWLVDSDAERATALATAWQIPVSGPIAKPGDLPPSDIVLLAVPVHVRASYLDVLRERGTAVLCEKPFARNASEHLDFCRGFGDGRIGVGFQRRTLGQNRLIREVISAGWFGPLKKIRVKEGGRTMRAGAGGYFLDSLNGRMVGVLTDLGSHTLDMVFSSVPPQADIAVRTCEMVMDDGIDRHVEASFSFDSTAGRIEVDYCVSWLDTVENAAWWEFENATVRMGLAPGAPALVLSAGRPAIRLEPEQSGARTSAQSFFLQWQSFLDGVRAGEDGEMGPASALWVARAIDAIHDKAGKM